MIEKTNPQEIKVVLLGLGAINLGLLKILISKKALLVSKHHINIRIVGVADSSGFAVKESGYDFDKLVNMKSKGNKVSKLEGFQTGVPTENIVNYIDADILVDGSPANLLTGNRGLQSIRNALQKRWSVVTANKAPLVQAYDELHTLAKKMGQAIAYSATVCGGMPVVNILKRDLQVTNLIGLRGVFNATTNFILEALENEVSFDEAIKEAQRVGAAEADPSLDIDGYDTANKLYLIMKSFSDFSGTLSDISIEGIRTINLDRIRQARRKNKSIKLMATAEKNKDLWKLSVSPIEVESSSFIGSCDGWEMGLELQTDYYENLSIKLYEEDPISSSAAVMRDIINLSKKG